MTMSSKWKDVIASVAPGLATVLTGGNPLAGAAVKVLADKLLGGSSGDPVADEAKLAGMLSGGLTPEVRIAIIESEKTLKQSAMQIGLEEKRIDASLETKRLDDVANARAEIGRVHVSSDAPWYVKARQPVLALLAVLGFLACLGSLLYLTVAGKAIDNGVKDILIYALGCLTSIVLMVYSFDFGTSSGSAGKDRVMADLLKR